MGRTLIRGFLTVLAGAFAVIVAAQLLKGNTLEYAVTEALVWSVISAAVFTGSRAYRLRKGQYCAVCGDVPPASARDGEPSATQPRP